MARLTGRTVVILCDAAATTGLGHFVRSTSLAAVLSARGADVHVVLPEDSVAAAVDRARDVGRTVHRAADRGLDAALDGALDAALHAGVGAPSAPSGPVVVVDTYRVAGPWLTALCARLHAVGGALAVIDDLADRAFEADLVLNQNAGAEDLPYPGVAQVLAGPHYALLRPEFPRHRDDAMRALEQLPDVPRRVLVLFGGTDATGMAWPAASAAALAFPDADVRVVSSAPPPELPPQVARRITRLDHVDRIHEEMLAADLVLSAGGTTLWELCCLARPMAVVAVAGNQQPTYDEMERRGAILPAGRTPVRDPEALADRLRELTGPGALRSAAAAAARITDGRGADRVADELAALAAAVPAGEETT